MSIGIHNEPYRTYLFDSAVRIIGSMTTDTLGRRSRATRQPTGETIRLKPRDYLVFQKLHEHGPLPTSYLYAFTKHLGSDETGFLKRLNALFHEGYLDRPKQQFNTIDARYNQLVYDINQRSTQLLKDTGQRQDFVPALGGPWKHRCMTACITASFEIGTLGTSMRYIPAYRILERASAKTGRLYNELSFPVPMCDPKTCVIMRNPATGEPYTRDLKPDALFGLEYQKQGGSSFMFFAVEADRATESHTSDAPDRKTFTRSVLQYRQFVGAGLYKEYLQLTEQLLVLYVSTGSEQRMQHMLEIVRELSANGRNSYLCFQNQPGFGVPFKPTMPMSGLLFEPWMLAGNREFSAGCPHTK